MLPQRIKRIFRNIEFTFGLGDMTKKKNQVSSYKYFLKTVVVTKNVF